jgi:hypothetical protein
MPDYGPLVFTGAAQLVRPSLRVQDCVLPVLANQQYSGAKDIGIVDHGNWYFLVSAATTGAGF